MKEKYSVVVEKCLMELPPEFLDKIKYDHENVELSEFHLRMKYVKHHLSKLDDKQKSEILLRCDLMTLNPVELKELYTIGVVDYERYIELRFELMEREKEEDSRKIVNLSNEVERLKKENETMKHEIEMQDEQSKLFLI